MFIKVLHVINQMFSCEMKSEFQIAYLQTAISALCFGKLWFAVSHIVNKCNSIFLSVRKQGSRRLWHAERWTTCRQILMGTVPFLLESLIPYLADACLLSRPLYLLQIHQFEMLPYSILTDEKRLFTERKKHILLVSDHVTSFLSRFYVLCFNFWKSNEQWEAYSEITEMITNP